MARPPVLRVALVTVTCRVALSAPRVPVMMAVPGATAVTRPVALTVAMDGASLLQLTSALTSRLLPSL